MMAHTLTGDYRLAYNRGVEMACKARGSEGTEMKKTATLAIALAVGATQIAVASPNYSILGAALGAAAGFVVANNVEDVSAAVAVPVLAVVGGIVGNQVNQRLKHQRNAYDYSANVPIPPPGLQPQVADPHPGVDLIKVSIVNSNGARTDVPILHIRDKFVGPQGETYDSLPSAALLARRYGM
jgi:hypothetical protein